MYEEPLNFDDISLFSKKIAFLAKIETLLNAVL